MSAKPGNHRAADERDVEPDPAERALLELEPDAERCARSRPPHLMAQPHLSCDEVRELANAQQFSVGTLWEPRGVDSGQLESRPAELVLAGYACRGVCWWGASVS